MRPPPPFTISAEDKPTAPALAEREVELLDICVRIAQFIGLPKSVGELYGLLFVSAEPLPLDMFVERLQMSKGSASQGLKQLRALGAIKPSYVAGDRRDHYVAETDLNKLVGGLLRERIQPAVADLAERLQRIQGHEARNATPGQKALQERLVMLQSWQKKIEKILPLAETFLGIGAKGGRSS